VHREFGSGMATFETERARTGISIESLELASSNPPLFAKFIELSSHQYIITIISSSAYQPQNKVTLNLSTCI